MEGIKVQVMASSKRLFLKLTLTPGKEAEQESVGELLMKALHRSCLKRKENDNGCQWKFPNSHLLVLYLLLIGIRIEYRDYQTKWLNPSHRRDLFSRVPQAN